MNPLQVPQQGPYEERGPFTGHFAYLSKASSFEFPSKGALPQGPLHGIFRERDTSSPCPSGSLERSPPNRAPTTYQSPWYTSPPTHTRFPSGGKEPPWREIPASGDFLNISSKVPSEGAASKAPSTEPVQREMLHPPEPPSSISQSSQ